MISCPICGEKIPVINLTEITQHLVYHKNRGDPHTYPLRCCDCAHPVELKNSKTFRKHYSDFHSNLLEKGPNVAHVNAATLNFAENLGNDINVEADINADHIEANFIDNMSAYDIAIFNVLLELVSKSSLPFKTLSQIVKSFSSFVELIASKIKQNFEDGSLEDDRETLEKNTQKELRDALSALSSVDTNYKISRKFESHPQYVAPIPVEFGLRNDMRLTRSIAKNIVVKEEGYVVPISKTLQSLLVDPELFSLIERENLRAQNNPLVYTRYADGSSFKNNPLFSDRSRLVIQLQLNNDDMGTTNPLRGHASIHKVGTVFFTIQNLPPRYNTASVNVHLAAQYHSVDVKKYGFGPVLNPLMEDIRLLEMEGIDINVKNLGTRRIFATISNFCGDALGMNQIFGMVESFSCDYCCVICYATREQMGKYFFESDFELRTQRSFELDLEELEDSQVHHVRGVKRESFLNSSAYFNIANNKNYDIMHVYLEGILPYEVGALLYEYVEVRKLFSWVELNARIRRFYSGLQIEKGNTPCELNPIKNQADGISPKLAAVEMWSLFRFLPLIIGDLVPSDSHWEFFLQLQTLTDYAFATSVSESMLSHFTYLYSDHMHLFKKLFPNLRVKPKQHFMSHFRSMVQANGPLALTSCLKFELRNHFSKRLSHVVCNFKNIAQTLTSRNQYNCLANQVRGDLMRDRYAASLRSIYSSLHLLPCSQKIATLFNIPEDAEIKTSPAVTYFGRKYSIGNVVVLGKESSDLKFGVIEHILWHKNEAYVLAKELHLFGFYSHYHSYHLNIQRDSYAILKIEDLLDFHPLDYIYKTESNEHFVRLRHHIP